MSDTAKNAARAADMAKGLRALAAFVEANPDLTVEATLHYQTDGVHVPVYEKDTVAGMARAGVKAGAKVTKHQSEKYAGVDLNFSENVSLHVYIDREQICERIVTGTREVTEEVPDPAALAAVPKLSVTKVVEDVEWVCRPILTDEVPALAKAGA